jgi:hypothetical protein
MKTLYLVPSALLAAAVVFGAPSASAETSAKAYRMTFAYNPGDAPQKIYGELNQAARATCRKVVGAKPLMFGETNRCTREVVKAAISAIAREDLAQLHDRSARG